MDCLNMKDAAAACGVPVKELEKRRREGAFPNAVFESFWLIPLSDLVSAGYQPDKDWLRRRQQRVKGYFSKGQGRHGDV